MLQRPRVEYRQKTLLVVAPDGYKERSALVARVVGFLSSSRTIQHT